MKKGALLGKGMTAKVYEWGQDKVLKLYSKRFTEDWALYEAEVGRAVYEAGVPSPRVYGTVDLEGRKGVIFQRISGRSVPEHIIMEPYLLYYYVQKIARLHYKIHECTSKRLPSQRERFKNILDRSSGLLGGRIDRILNYLDHLPDGNSVCHGDMHINNIIVSKQGLIPIDWSGAYRGCPLGDVARTCMIITSPSAPPGTPDILTRLSGCVKQTLYQTYLTEYMRLAKVSFSDIDKWILPVAAGKLKDKIPGEEKWLMNIIDKRLEGYEKSNLHGVNQNEY